MSQRFKTDLLDPSIHDEYDPFKPNDFDAILAKKQREFLRKKEALEKSILGHTTVNQSALRSPPQKRPSPPKKRYRSPIPPPSAPHRRQQEEVFVQSAPVKMDLEISGDEAFQRRMKMRQTKNEQPPPPPPPVQVQSSSHVVLITNLANSTNGGIWLEEELEDYAHSICSDYGDVVKCLGHSSSRSSNNDTRIFVEFASVRDAKNACQNLDNTSHNRGKVIKVRLYNENKYNEMELDD